MKPVLLVDFGSTYTKATAVDLEAGGLLGTAASFTTVETDINEGLSNACAILKEKTGVNDYTATYACSSAAGGLKMAAIGLVPELTVQAAKEASLGAGAKIMKTYAFKLTKSDVREIDRLRPDILLLTGGTDGGNSETILANAKKLTALEADIPIVIAGNRCCADDCEEILEGRQIYVCENVMPSLGKLNILPAQKIIRELFLKKIVQGKGLTKAMELMTDIIMPTPSAILEAMQLLANGTGSTSGIGELLGVDLGGATTDVYSIATGSPTNMKTVYKGLEEPYAKRTVEGDIGMRYSMRGVVEAVGSERLASMAGLTAERLEEMLSYLEAHKDAVPRDEEFLRLDDALASAAVETAAIRHAGTIELAYTPMGETYVQSGKDLRNVKNIVVTGGALIHSKNVEKIARYAGMDGAHPESLRPENAGIWVDKKYLLAAMGLLGKNYPETALEIMKREIIYYGDQK